MAKFKVGTRDSLLAVTQTKQVINILEKSTDHEFEMVTMKTSGDLDTSRPLWQMDGKNFFTKELDHALLKGEVDFIVSSYKDIGSDRPKGIIPAAVTKRQYANDILLIKKETISRLATIETLIIGTSSPRRITNIERDLSTHLPSSFKGKVECKNLRGNVNTRIQKLRDGQYDAIILAMAGLERLALSDSSKIILEELLSGITFMVLPLKTFPSAPAQGALLLECLAENEELLRTLKVVHDVDSYEEIEIERRHFRSFGGGCHLAVGIYSKKIANGMLSILRGVHNNNEIYEISFSHPLKLSPKDTRGFIGVPSIDDTDFLSDKVFTKEFWNADLGESQQVFLTSPYGISSLVNSCFNNILWVSGDKTFRKAVASNLWVNGSSDALGEQIIQSLRESKALKLMGTNTDLAVLSSDEAKSSLGKVIPCYRKKESKPSAELTNELQSIRYFFWTSYSQYKKYIDLFPFLNRSELTHCCGLGKTFRDFTQAGIAVVPFADINDFKLIFKR